MARVGGGHAHSVTERLGKSDKMFGLFIVVFLMLVAFLAVRGFWPSLSAITTEASMDLASGFAILLGTVWVAKGAALSGSKSADWAARLNEQAEIDAVAKDNAGAVDEADKKPLPKRTLPPFEAPELAATLLEASEYCFQGIAAIFVGSAIALAKPIVATVEAHARSQEEAKATGLRRPCQFELAANGKIYTFAGSRPGPEPAGQPGEPSCQLLSLASTAEAPGTLDASTAHASTTDAAVSVPHPVTNAAIRHRVKNRSRRPAPIPPSAR